MDGFMQDLMYPGYTESQHAKILRFKNVIQGLKEENITLKEQILNLEVRVANQNKEKETVSQQEIIKALQQQAAHDQKEISNLQDEVETEKMCSKMKSLMLDFRQKFSDDLEKKISVLKKKIAKREEDFDILSKKLDEERNCFESKEKASELRILELLKQVSEVEEILVIEKNKFEKEKECFEKEKDAENEKLVKFVRSLQDDLNESESNCTDHLKKRKDLEARNIKLSKQVSDFEKIILVERSRFGQEREKYDKEILELNKKISELQKVLEDEKKKKSVVTDFEKERSTFESEIRKLTSKLSELSTDVMIEQRIKSDLQM